MIGSAYALPGADYALKVAIEEAKNAVVPLNYAIDKIEKFLTQNYSDYIKDKAQIYLVDYKAKYEKVKKEREAEKNTGIRIISIKTGWEASGLFQSEIFAPVVRIKVKNISEKELEKVKIHVDFVNPKTKEIFGNADDYVVGYSDTPLKPGYSANAICASGMGYKTYVNPPALNAEIYINDVFYKTVSVKSNW